MGALVGDPHRHGALVRAPLRHHRPGLHGSRRQPLLQDPLLDRDLRLIECGLGIGVVGQIPGDVVGQRGMRLGAVRLQGLFQVPDRRQRFVVDVHQRGRVAGLVLLLGDHHGHGLALVDRLLERQRRPVGDGLFFGHEGRCHRRRPQDHAVEVLGREHRDHPGSLLGLGGIDHADLGVRIRAAYEGGVGGVRPLEVVHVAAAAGHQAGVLAAVDLGSYHLRDRHGPSSRWLVWRPASRRAWRRPTSPARPS